MSDFIYSKRSLLKGNLSGEIKAIYDNHGPSVKEFHGEWGSLATSQNLYNGFQPYETLEHICVVVGGPILLFQDNKFLNGGSEDRGTQAIFNRWLDGNIQWDEDLSGAFSILIINKNTSEVLCVTDLMSFIPVYIYQDANNVMLSTHVDVLANVSGQESNLDIVSNVDFILHGVVTFPYTVYAQIQQITPASEHLIKDEFKYQTLNYWLPVETYKYKSINKAAEDLRNGLNRYVHAITSEVSKVAQFISGGEDSRALSALLEEKSNRDAIIFLDHMNREGKVAEKAAKAYDANFKLATRSKLHYLEILAGCSNLVGGGSQYHHAHTYGFHKSCRLNDYSAVFGGLLSDALLKGSHVKKLRGSGRFPFLPDIKRPGYSARNPLNNNLFTSDVLNELTKRRQAHLRYVESFRNESAEEWFELWPSSMNMNIPNIHANRRLFRSYEPFMAKDVIKISASVPQKMKLNRRLFNKAAKPLLKPTKWLLHSDGRLPYFPWYISCLVQFFIWLYQQVGITTGLIKGNQGPWGEWEAIMNSREWKQTVETYSNGLDKISSALKVKEIEKLFKSSNLDQKQQVNLLQAMYNNHKK